MNTDQVFADIAEDGKSIDVFFLFNEEDVKKIKRGVFGSKFRSRQYAERKGYKKAYWEIPLDITSGVQLREQFGDRLVLGDNLKKWGNKTKKTHSKLSDLAKADGAKLKKLPKVLPKLNKFLRPYQKAGVMFAATAPNPLIADQPGLGKTVQAIGAIFEAGTAEGANLVIAPKVSLETVWARELRKHQPYKVWVATGGRNQREDVLTDFYITCVLDEEPGWLIVNPHMVSYRRIPNPDYDPGSMDPRKASRWMLKDDGTLELDTSYNMIGDVEWMNVIIDEAHKNAIRNPNTMTARGMYDLKVGEDGKKIALSGTPMDHPIHLWGTLHWLHPEKFTSKWKWAEQWLQVSNNGYGYVIGGIKDGLREEFFRSLNPYILRRTKTEVFKELPEKQRVDMWVDMEAEQAKQYKEFVLQAMIKFEDEAITATSILAELMRLKQIAIAKQNVQERIVKGEKVLKLIPTEHSAKLEAVEQLLDERGMFDKKKKGEGHIEGIQQEKVVIFSQFKEVAKMLSAWLDKRKVKHFLMTGDTSQPDRVTIQDEFQKEGGNRILIMTTQAGGMSITLDRADSAIFMDELWTASDMEQAEDRLHRVSRIHNVTCYYIRTNDTIDQKIMAIVKDKASITKEILDERRYMDLL